MPGKNPKIAAIFLLLSILMSLLAACASGKTGNLNQIVIAFAGSNYQDAQGNIHGQSELAGVQLAVEQINALGGINGKTVLLKTYDDQSDPATATVIAQKVAESAAVAVLGHSTNETSEAAALVYDEKFIPAVSLRPMSEKLAYNHETYYNAAITLEKQADYLANYLRKIKQTPKINVIYTQDLYSRTLAERFGNTFKGLGGSLRAEAVDHQSAEQITALIANWGIDPDQPEPIFIALPPQAAADLLVSLRRSGLNYPVVGVDNLSDPAFSRAIADLSEEKARPGYFTNDLLTTRILIFDSANADARRFETNYQAHYPGQEPGDPAILGYEAALLTLEAIRRAEPTGQDLNRDRQAVYEQLSDQTLSNQPINGATGLLAFDWAGNRETGLRFGTYQNGKIISAMTQFEPIPASANLQGLQDLVKTGRVTTVGGEYVYIINIVYAGVDIIDLREIDTKNSTYLLDFYLWFRYHPNPNDPAFRPEDFVFTNQQGDPTKVEISNEQADGNHPNSFSRITYRITGTFKNDFDFRAYPFDSQNLNLRFRNQNADTTSIQYVIDRIGMRDTEPNELFTHLTENGAFKSLYGWAAKSAVASQDTFATSSTQGNPHRFEQENLTRYSLIDVNILVQRISLEYIIKSLLPLFLTLILAYISFFLPLGHSERFGVGSTALLTTAFFHLNLATTLPEIGYTVLMEMFFYVSYALSVLMIVLETISIRLENGGEQEADEKVTAAITQKRERLNLIGRVVYPIILLTSFLLGGLVYKNILVWPPVDPNTLRTPAHEISERKNQPRPTEAHLTATPGSHEPITLKLSTWRPEDNQQLQIIFDAFHEYALAQYQRDIRIEPQPIMSTNYDVILNTQLERQEGPDLLYLRPFIANSNLTNYLLPLNETLGSQIEANFTPEKSQPWMSTWGNYYAVPYVGVIQGVYYNQEIFARENLSVPTTWEEFLQTAEALQEAGITPIANGLNANEDSEMFMSLMVNAVGGSAGRAEFSTGERCFSDPKIVTAFNAVNQLLPYLPSDAATRNSKASKLLFTNQKAAMLFGGSWDIKSFQEAGFKWSVFAPPAANGKTTHVIFQPDIAIAINQASPHREESLWFLEWLMTESGIQTTARYLPGFYPLSNLSAQEAGNQQGTDFLRLSTENPSDVRMIFSEISDHYPKGADLVRQALYEMASGKLQPNEAAIRLQKGLAEWYEPAQICK